MNFRKSLSALLSGFMAISALGGVSPLKAETEDFEESQVNWPVFCVASAVAVYMGYRAYSSFNEYKKEEKEAQEWEARHARRQQMLSNIYADLKDQSEILDGLENLQNHLDQLS